MITMTTKSSVTTFFHEMMGCGSPCATHGIVTDCPRWRW